MISKNNIVLGSGGHCRVILENLYHLKKKNIILYDINFSPVANNFILKNQVFDFKKILKKNINKKNNLYLALGSNFLRKKYFTKFNKKFIMPSLISPKSNISKYSKYGYANFFNHFSYIGANSILGDNNIINTYSLIEHDVKIGNHCHIGPGVKIGGKSIIEDNVLVGIGSILIDKIKICSNVIIGAGSIVTASISRPGTYVTVRNKLKKL